MCNWLKELRSNIFFRRLYLKTPVWDSGITPPEVIDFIGSHPPGRALDLGCGTGTNLLTLAENGWEASGIDFVPKAIRQARRKAKRAGQNIQLVVGDVSNARLFYGPYDLILDIGCYHVLSPEQRLRYQQNIFNHLAPDGTFMLYGFLSDTVGGVSLQDISAFQTRLELTRRQDSSDPSGPTSTWLWFRGSEV